MIPTLCSGWFQRGDLKYSTSREDESLLSRHEECCLSAHGEYVSSTPATSISALLRGVKTRALSPILWFRSLKFREVKWSTQKGTQWWVLVRGSLVGPWVRHLNTWALPMTHDKMPWTSEPRTLCNFSNSPAPQLLWERVDALEKVSGQASK